jgi:hypothetical protein
MDSDRKSAVSDFYLPRKATTGDPENSPSTPNFVQAHGRSSSAGYNQTSFLHAGREEPLKGGRDEEASGQEEPWDVYADFNNAGPRYSSVLPQNTQGYQQLPTPLAKGDDTASSIGPVEMVTVPGFGPEWKKSEMRDMTKAGKREKKAEGRRQIWTQWRRDQRGMFGKQWLTRRYLVFFLFGLSCVIALVLAFTIPRVPAFAFNSATPLEPASGKFAKTVPVAFSRAPANFSFPAFADLELDTQSNYLPLTFLHLRAQVFDLDTNRQIATGDLGRKTVPAKAFPKLQLPLNFTYVASNDTDQTWKTWHAACQNKIVYTDGKRPAVRFRLFLEAVIQGLPGKHDASTQVSDAKCPIELPSNAV